MAEPQPVAWLCKRSDGHYDVLTDSTCTLCFPVYDAPPSREWQYLTDDEILDIFGRLGAGYPPVVPPYTRQLLSRIEAKLKEKNDGSNS